MNESEWLECTEPFAMLEFLKGNISDRKLRLFACACCRRIWNFIADERSKNAVIAAESFAENSITALELNRTRTIAFEVLCSVSGLPIHREGRFYDASSAAAAAAYAVTNELNPVLPIQPDDYNTANAIELSANAFVANSFADFVKHDWSLQPNKEAYEFTDQHNSIWEEARIKELSALTPILREIVGNLFRPVTLDPRWLTSTVVDLAKAIYDERAFDKMPILADALMDAGCDNEEIISHCRSEAAHVRGCWVVDLLLGKE